MSEYGPEAEAGGAPTPPSGRPATALATSTPMPRAPGRLSAGGVPRQWRGLRALVDSALDGLDAIADRFAEAAGLR